MKKTNYMTLQEEIIRAERRKQRKRTNLGAACTEPEAVKKAKRMLGV